MCMCGQWKAGSVGVSAHWDSTRADSKRCMSDDCSRQHGKYKIGQLLKMHCAEQAF